MPILPLRISSTLSHCNLSKLMAFDESFLQQQRKKKKKKETIEKL